MAQIVQGRVFHARVRPKHNAFGYNAFYLLVPISELIDGIRCSFLSLNRFNLFSLYFKDYDAGARPRTWIRDLLAQWDVKEADGEILLLTMPRVLGYAFNPVSFWLCFDRQKSLRAVVAEVNNTFGERHSYLCLHDDRRPITGSDWLHNEKNFYVSPFLSVEGHYRFRFVCSESKISVWINHFGAEGLRLSTSLIGERKPLTSLRLLGCFFRYPLVTLKVIALIHYQAAILILKGVRRQDKPAPPAVDVTR